MKFFRGLFRLLPSWLREGEGALVDYSLGLMADYAAEVHRLSAYVRFPEYAPPDALAHIGRDRKIVRGIGETDEAYAARLVEWLDKHRVRGNPYALLEQLRAYMNQDVRVRTVDARGNWYTIDTDGTRTADLATGTWQWDAMDPARWSRFWVILYPTAGGEPWADHTLDVGDPGLWGDAVGTTALTLGSSATPEHISKVRTIIRDWQPDGTRCEWVIVAFDPDSFDPSAPEPDGNWAKWGEDDGSGNYVSARLATARYFRGAAAREYP